MASSLRARVAGKVQKLMILATLGAVAAGGWELIAKETGRAAGQQVEVSYRHRSSEEQFSPAAAQWKTLGIEPVSKWVFRYEHVTEGRIAVDEDHSTLVFSPYSGRAIRLLAKPGDAVKAGQLLFTIEATDMVQAQNDFIAGIAARNKARSQLAFAEIDERRYRTLSKDHAVAVRDFEQAQTALVAAQNDVRAAETALEAVRNVRVHARANKLLLELEYGQRLILRVTDDGIGMDSALLEHGRPGHFGLQGMRECAAHIEAKLTITSAPGAGTVITLIVPGKIAFQTDPSSYFSRFRTPPG